MWTRRGQNIRKFCGLHDWKFPYLIVGEQEHCDFHSFWGDKKNWLKFRDFVAHFSVRVRIHDAAVTLRSYASRCSRAASPSSSRRPRPGASVPIGLSSPSAPIVLSLFPTAETLVLKKYLLLYCWSSCIALFN